MSLRISISSALTAASEKPCVMYKIQLSDRATGCMMTTQLHPTRSVMSKQNQASEIQAAGSPEVVAFWLMEKIGYSEFETAKQEREYWLKLYEQCLSVVRSVSSSQK
jgi:hypothetical protein